MRKINLNLIIFLSLILIYVIGQILIGTYSPSDHKFHFNTPSDIDFLYYGAITNTVLDQFPPENPAFAGTKLTQPFLQYYPASFLAKVINPYNSIRILNVLYLVLFGLLLKKYFPKRYAIPLLLIFAGSTFGAKLNSLGVDFIARGFTHAPFFILLTVAFFDDNPRLRYISLIIAALINGYLTLMVLIFLAINAVWKKRDKEIYMFISCLIGMILAFLMVSSAAVDKPFYFILTESFGFDISENLVHAAPFFILIFFYRQREATLLFLVAFLFGSFFHYNPFFPIFLIYYSGALMVLSGEKTSRYSQIALSILCCILFIGFISASFKKYNPSGGGYYPRFDHRLDPSLNWIRKNTDSDATFMALTADAFDMALVMQYRPVYLGFIGHVSHLGLNWRERYNNTTKAYRMGIIPDGIDYLFYGPIEKKYFPGMNFSLDEVYRDNNVTIFKAPI